MDRQTSYLAYDDGEVGVPTWPYTQIEKASTEYIVTPHRLNLVVTRRKCLWPKLTILFLNYGIMPTRARDDKYVQERGYPPNVNRRLLFLQITYY